ncbi:DUF192 domain-containing protein [Alteriqipengyuania lutimaris]|uniref:DUF192 domain-containing protein n=1 Tax=Alteriqipengyuania lutimaris TaxID=1538146 RepID=A0A395LJA9_9SPHN|nr:DUF192 domain-containing protein [Alteriqipengyuania lutimaris]MBB3033951.1 hypothetical protein [Alteriqipengyuania lutimaris]RDS77096.1 DUF192 domain-containing protein [Alteriqipengyuania lutimaris]
MTWAAKGAAGVLLCALMACSPQQGGENASAVTASATHPVSGLELVPVTVETDDGAHRFTAEVARSAEEQARGLMFRTELGPDEAMIFPRDGDIASFWMKNTPLPLDIVFIGRDRRILNIAARTTPYSLDSVTAVGPTSAVLEIPGGRAEELGIEPGDRVEW